MPDTPTRLAALAPRRLRLLDVGARWGLQEPWTTLPSAVDVIAFEPDPEEYQTLLAAKRPGDAVFNTALGAREGRAELRLTASRGSSSLFTPNMRFLGQFPDARRFDVEAVEEVAVEPLDALFADGRLDGLDFAKIDVQGAELDILKGGRKALSEHALGLEVEVEFHPLYEGQPLFSDVDPFVRGELGLELQDLRKTYWKYPEGIGVGGTKGKLIFGDALYLRPPDGLAAWCGRLDAPQAAEKLQLACLAAAAYGLLDYSLRVLAQEDARTILGPAMVEAWRAALLEHGRCRRYEGRFAPRLAQLLHLLYRAVQPMHQGWASIGQPLGLRKRFGVFF